MGMWAHEQLNEGFFQREDSGVWIPQGGVGQFDYSDGDDHEQFLTKVLSRVEDLSVASLPLRAAINSWPSEYHLSPLRSNLFRPFDRQLKGKNVLEVGAGCGACSRYLGETGAHVLALEGSISRARIARQRCRDLANVELACAPLSGASLHMKAHIVTLIGVLEYAGMYVQGARPDVTLLKQCRASLHEDGVLILAIENQLGLKYWAGAEEDHTMQPFFGIEDRYTQGGVRTYGMAELRELLAKSGFSFQCFYFPLPDYKLPSMILTEQGIEESDFDDLRFFLRSCRYRQGQPAHSQLCMEGVLRALYRNRLQAQFANSFLVVAAANPVALQCFIEPHKDVFAFSYSLPGKEVYWKEAVFQAARGSIEVSRRSLGPRTSESMAQHLVENEPFFSESSLLEQLVPLLQSPDWTLDQLWNWMQPWLRALEETFSLETGFDAATVLPCRAFDAIPDNLLVREDGHFCFIDLEWEFQDREITAGLVVFRGLLNSLMAVSCVQQPCESRHLKVHTLLLELLQRFDAAVSDEVLGELVELEFLIQGDVQDIVAPRVCLDQCLRLVRNHEDKNYKLQREIGNTEQLVEGLRSELRSLSAAYHLRGARLAEVEPELARSIAWSEKLEKDVLELRNAIEERDKTAIELTRS